MSESRDKPLLVLLGNQLFPDAELPPPGEVEVYLAEDLGLCTYVKHHQQKIVLFLAAMRARAGALEDAGYTVHYHRLDDDGLTYPERLLQFIEDGSFGRVALFEVEDRWFEKDLLEALENADIDVEIRATPMFLTPRDELEEQLGGRDHLKMADFYRWQRKRLGLLMDPDGQPQGGQWSFDADNREPLPDDEDIAEPCWFEPDDATQEVIERVADRFGDHPGDASDFRWPVTREHALKQWQAFLDDHLRRFGPMQDAITERSAFVHHSVISPALNLGLVTPRELLDSLLGHASEHDVPLNSLEGLVRQIIGWREFIRGVDRLHGETQADRNFWDHQRRMSDHWDTGDTGIPLLDQAIRRANRHGWAHHIERLMVLGNLMTLCEIEPREAYRWFMERFVDSSDWVMGPNVYGMGLFSDGGLFATKPYICGSNYLLKMSDAKKGDWCDAVDGLYWRFVGKHRDFFESNPRLAMMPRTLDRMNDERLERISAAAEDFLDRCTISP